MYFALNMTWTQPTLWIQVLRKLGAICSFWTCQMYLSWQAQDAANLMVSDFAKASRNLQLLDLPGAFFVAGTGRGQPYGFRFCESFAQFAAFGLARCIFRGRRRTRPTLWFQILRKLRTILQLLDLRDAFCVAGAGRGQPYDHFSWQALYESTNRKVGNA